MPDERPNIVVMVSDDHGLDMDAYGNSAIATPGLDALADDGVCFTDGFCTTASCAASRSVILTGIYNHANGTYGHTHGCHHFRMFEDTVTLPALMNEAGYETARVGKRHYAPDELFPWKNEIPEGTFARDDVRMAEACRDFVVGGDPFFLYYCSRNPHRGNGVVEDHPCKPDRFGNPVEAYPNDTEQTFTEDEIQVPDYLPDIPEVRAELTQYYQSVARLDRGIGRLMEILKEEGKYDNTLIIYISDNGAAFPGAKTTLYEPGMNLPLIVRSPLHDAHGTRCDGLVTWADIAPTVLDFAESYHDPQAFHGDTFKGIIDQESPDDWREEAYTAHTFHEIINYYPMRVVRQHRYKFIWNIASPLTYPSASDLWRAASWQGALDRDVEFFGKRTVEDYLHRDAFELYDLENDPHETENLAYQPDYGDMVDEFCEKLRAFQKRTDDPWISKWEYE